MPPRLPNWVIGASAAAGVVLTPVLAPAALGIVGFSAAGPVAGTLAAAIQSSIGNVVAGSAFAVAQSIAMGGAIPAGVYAASGVAAGVVGWAASWFGGGEPDPTLIRRQLDSSSDREKLDAMRTLIGLMSKDRDVSEYFSQVIKNVTSQVFEIRKLVYIYLVRYAEQRPELSLHSINTFQDDLNDSDPLIQAMALRVLCGISNPALIHKQLDSGSDKEKLGAMKTLIALMSDGRDVSEYFAHVIKNVTSQIFEIRKLVYIYLLKYSEQEPELSLRFINTFQSDLNDNDPLIQAMALRVLCGIKPPTTGNTTVPEESKSEDGYSSDGPS